MATRAGVILAVADVERSLAFYRDALGFEVEALYDDPPYATLALAGTRLSLAEQGHPADDRPGIELAAPADRSRADALLVVEVEDARGEHSRLGERGVRFLAEPYEPPWGGCRFFCVDPDGYLVEIEQPGVGSTEPAESRGAGSAGAGAGQPGVGSTEPAENTAAGSAGAGAGPA